MFGLAGKPPADRLAAVHLPLKVSRARDSRLAAALGVARGPIRKRNSARSRRACAFLLSLIWFHDKLATRMKRPWRGESLQDLAQPEDILSQIPELGHPTQGAGRLDKNVGGRNI